MIGPEVAEIQGTPKIPIYKLLAFSRFGPLRFDRESEQKKEKKKLLFF